MAAKRRYSSTYIDHLNRLHPLRLSGNALALYYVLASGPHTTILPGLSCVGRAALAEQLHFDLDMFDAAFIELQAKRLACADWPMRVVYVPGLCEDTPPPPNADVVEGWCNTLAGIPECEIKNAAIRDFAAHLKALDTHRTKAPLSKPFVDRFGAVLTPCPPPSVTPCPPPSVTPCPPPCSTVTVTVTDTETDRREAPDAAPAFQAKLEKPEKSASPAPSAAPPVIENKKPDDRLPWVKHLRPAIEAEESSPAQSGRAPAIKPAGFAPVGEIVRLDGSSQSRAPPVNTRPGAKSSV